MPGVQNKLAKKVSEIMGEGGGELAKQKTRQIELSESETEIDNYTMLSDVFDYDELRERDNFGIKGYKDSIYKGQLDGRKREGKGVCVNDNGRVYEGDWKSDKRCGYGYEYYPAGNYY